MHMGSRLVFAHMPFPLWCWPSSIDKNNSLQGETTVDGWGYLKHQRCLHHTPLTYKKEDQSLSIEPFLARVDLSARSYHHAWERYWEYICQGLVPKGVWTRLHQHWLDTLSAGFAPTGATTCLHALCVLLDAYNHILCHESTARLACSTNLTEEIRSQTF